MKRIFLSAFMCACMLGVKAQDELTFKPFKVDLAIGYAIPKGQGTKGGVLFALEPKYAINDQFTLGLRMEAAITAYAALDFNGNIVTGEVKGSSSYLATADYYFGKNAVRPFVGCGAGIFLNVGAQLEGNDQVETKNNFGFTPRVGLETGHFRAAVEYNVAGKTAGMSNNYIGLKLGFFFGGGRYR